MTEEKKLNMPLLSQELRAKIMDARMDEMTNHDVIIETLREMKLGLRLTKQFCETELGYSLTETRTILASLQLIITSEALTSSDPNVRTNISKLREWRRIRAKAQGVPAYRVLTNRVLLSLASECPKTPEKLQELKGFGQKTRAVYGDELLALLSC